VSRDHQRWEIETAYLELKSTILGGRVLLARIVEINKVSGA
jgi:hypothetical protein